MYVLYIGMYIYKNIIILCCIVHTPYMYMSVGSVQTIATSHHK